VHSGLARTPIHKVCIGVASSAVGSSVIAITDGSGAKATMPEVAGARVV
jgi:hypothetical protein